MQNRIVWGRSLSPGLSTRLPLMNTLLAVDMHPAVALHRCPVAALSILSLDTAGIRVFIAGENSVISYRGGV